MAAITVEQALQLARAHQQAGRLAEAEAIYRQVLAQQPNRADVLHHIGVIALATGRLEQALELNSQAVRHAADKPVYHSNLGETYRRLGRLPEAISSYQRALALQPGLAETHAFLGAALVDAGRFEEAIAHCQQALALQPGLAVAHHNLGIALTKVEQWTSALPCFERAVALEPDSAESHYGLGTALAGTGQWQEALASCRRALNLRPACAETHFNLALLLLRLGQFAEGWREHEWRCRLPSHASRHPEFFALLWDGTPMPGKLLYVHAEQGIGDTLHFLRYIPLAQRVSGARVIFECQPSLLRLLTPTGDSGVQVIGRGPGHDEPRPSCDRHAPLLSLPFILKIDEPLELSEPYLQADAGLRDAWRQRLEQGPAFRVGLAWASNPKNEAERRRSISFEKLKTLWSIPGVCFYSLQIDRGMIQPSDLAEEKVIDLTAQITDFADTAALMSELDLIITVDTANAHLAGALGRPVWTLLASAPDWRWGLEGEKTPWYPTMRLLRQKTAGDWDEVIHRVAEELRGQARAKNTDGRTPRGAWLTDPPKPPL